MTIKTNNSNLAVGHRPLNAQQAAPEPGDARTSADSACNAVCVDGEPHCLTLTSLIDRDIDNININDKASKSNSKLAKVVFEPLILIEDKVELYFHIRMQRVKFKLFPFGANSLSDGSDGKLMLYVTAPPGAALLLANVMISLPSKYVSETDLILACLKWAKNKVKQSAPEVTTGSPHWGEREQCL